MHDEPCITVKHGRRNTYGHGIAASGPGLVVQSLARPLPCGARVWVESRGTLDVYRRAEDGTLPTEMAIDPGAEILPARDACPSSETAR